MYELVYIEFYSRVTRAEKRYRPAKEAAVPQNYILYYILQLYM